MKPNDIDAIISSKLQENHDLYQDEMNASKPFIWGEIRSQINTPKTFTWYQMAAVIVLLLVIFGFVFRTLNQQHQLEMTTLAEQVNILQKANHSQTTRIKAKANQIMALQNEMELIATELTGMSNNPEPTQTQFLHKVDTIYITEPESKIVHSKPIDSGDHYIPKTLLKPVLAEKFSEPEIDEVIFPDYSADGNKPAVETPIKVRFGTFTAKKN